MTDISTIAKDSMATIPKIIMQTWKTTELPEKWRATQVSIKKYMPDWQYVLMTDEMNRDFIAQYFTDFLPYYDKFPYPIQRADAVRYAWLYIHGGLYLDCDFELLAPIDELFTENYALFLLASSNTPSVITNGFMAAKPRHPLWLAMMEEMKKDPGLMAIEKHLLVMNTTGPMALTRVVKQLNPDYKLLPSAKINPYTLCETVYNKQGALMRPLEGSSWVGGAAVLYQWCYCQSNFLAAIIAIIVLVLVIIYIITS